MAATDPSPRATVERFLGLLRAGDLEGAAALMAADVTYANVGLVTVHGRDRALRVLRVFLPRGSSFDVEVHSIAAGGETVLTERTDTISRGRFRVAFWVCGRFDVRDGEIVLWRDYFDYRDVALATLRGALAALLRGSRPPARGSRDAR